MINLTNYSYSLLGKWPCRYKAFNLNLDVNLPLRIELFNDGFFDFNFRNNGNIVYYHQIVAFYNCGGIHALKRGLTCDSSIIEIHHLNGNTLDNRKSNLIYLPRVLHTEITTVQRKLCKYLKTFRSNYKGHSLISKLNSITIWNSQGRIISNCLHFTMSVLIKTIKSSSITFQKDLSLSLFSSWLKKTYRALKSFFPLWHVPINWVF